MYTNIYSTPRQLNFVSRQLSLFRQGWMIAAAAVFGLFLVISVVTAYFNPSELRGLRGLYHTGLTIGGLIFTSQMFQELHAANRSYAFLTLPVSTLEKLVGSWLLSAPLFILGYTVVTFAIYLLSALVAGRPEVAFNYFGYEYWKTVGNYLVIQTIFLWGACYFRKMNFLKTLLVIVVVPIIVGLYGGLLGWMLFGGETNIQINDTTFNSIFGGYFPAIMKFLYYGVFGPYMLVTTYFTLRERQV